MVLPNLGASLVVFMQEVDDIIGPWGPHEDIFAFIVFFALGLAVFFYRSNDFAKV